MLVTGSERVETLTSTGKGYIGKAYTAVNSGTFVTSGTTATTTSGVDLRKYALSDAYVYSSTNNELRKITWYPNASGEPTNVVKLESAFTSPVAGDNFVVVLGKYKSIYARNTGASAGTIAGGSIPAGGTLPISDVYRIEPFVFDGTGTTLVFTLTY
jgi:hypothetical protein